MDDKYKQHSITITLNFDTMNLPSVDLNVVEKVLATSHWDEGRYPFYEEMVHVGLAKMLECAIGAAVWKQMEKQYKGQMVKVDNGETSLVHIKTEEAMRGVSAHIMDSVKVASIGRPVKE